MFTKAIQTVYLAMGCFTVCAAVGAQTAPKSHDRIWLPDAPSGTMRSAVTRFSLDPTKTYTLSELVDVAEQHNPETRVAWERAKAQAAAVGVARSSLFPVLATQAVAASVRQDVLFNEQWAQQTLGLFESTVALTYTVCFRR